MKKSLIDLIDEAELTDDELVSELCMIFAGLASVELNEPEYKDCDTVSYVIEDKYYNYNLEIFRKSKSLATVGKK